jgi:Ca2+-binding EF-hand superfamily protein
MFDLNNDGYITKDCLMKMFHATSNVQMKMLHELLKFSRDQLIVDGHHDIAKQFQIDIDQLSEQKTRTDEEEKKMHEEYSIAVQELAQEIFDEVDLDGDSKISYQEFCKSKILLAEVERLSAHKVSFFAT